MNTKYQIISTTFSHPLIFVLEAEAGELLELSRVQDQPEQHNKASSDKRVHIILHAFCYCRLGMEYDSSYLTHQKSVK